MPGSNNFCDTTACIDYIATNVMPNVVPPAGMTINAIYPYEVDAIPNFPSIAIVDMGLRRAYSGSHMFTLELNVRLVVMHGKLSDPAATRQQKELQLARSVTLALHRDRQLGGNIVQGWVAKDVQGTLASQDSGAIKCSFLDWIGEAREVDDT